MSKGQPTSKQLFEYTVSTNVIIYINNMKEDILFTVNISNCYKCSNNIGYFLGVCGESPQTPFLKKIINVWIAELGETF